MTENAQTCAGSCRYIAEVCVCVSVKRGLPYGKRDLLYAQKRPTDILAYLKYAYAYASKEAYQMAKETYHTHKRDLLLTLPYLFAGVEHAPEHADRMLCSKHITYNECQ